MNEDTAFEASSPVGTTEIDLDEIDRRIVQATFGGGNDAESQFERREWEGDPTEKARELECERLLRVLRWVRQAETDKGRSIRIQTLLYFLGDSTQPALAREIGVTKAAISRAAVELAEIFKIEHPSAAASSMRTDKSRKTFSEVCKKNHQKRKQAQSESTQSGSKSGKNSGKPLDLRQIVKDLANQQLLPRSNAGNS